MYEVKVTVFITLDDVDSESAAISRAKEIMQDSRLGDSEANVVSVGTEDFSAICLEEEEV